MKARLYVCVEGSERWILKRAPHLCARGSRWLYNLILSVERCADGSERTADQTAGSQQRRDKRRRQMEEGEGDTGGEETETKSQGGSSSKGLRDAVFFPFLDGGNAAFILHLPVPLSMQPDSCCATSRTPLPLLFIQECGTS